MRKNSNPFGANFSVPYHNIGRGEKKKRPPSPKYIENLRYGTVTKDNEEIELCLTCPYPRCVEKCKRLRDYRKAKAKEESKTDE